MNDILRSRAAVIVVAVALIVITIGVSLAVSAKHAQPIAPERTNPPTYSATPAAVTQPPSAKAVAASLHCENFVDQGPSTVGGVVDSGTCWRKGVEYAIDTFPSKAVRDVWLPSAEQLGVVPKWETDTAVIYKSVSA